MVLLPASPFGVGFGHVSVCALVFVWVIFVFGEAAQFLFLLFGVVGCVSCFSKAN